MILSNLEFKILISLGAILLLSITSVSANTFKSIQSDKLSIYASKYDGSVIKNPDDWLRFYEHENTNNENRIYITAAFDVPKAIALVIVDVHAENKLCQTAQKKFMLYLSFESDASLKKITTRIEKPCFVKNKALLRLNIKTRKGQRYYNTTVLKVHPNAFDPVSE